VLFAFNAALIATW